VFVYVCVCLRECLLLCVCVGINEREEEIERKKESAFPCGCSRIAMNTANPSITRRSSHLGLEHADYVDATLEILRRPVGPVNVLTAPARRSLPERRYEKQVNSFTFFTLSVPLSQNLK
jgi:hypothetical protein